jgi:hypothetical protein
MSSSGSYVYTDTTQAEFLSWKEGSGNGQIVGQWRQVSYQLPLSGKSQPSAVPVVSLTGTASGQTIQLTGNIVSFNGIIKEQTLKIESTDSSGQSVDQTWIPATEQDYNNLVTAFKAYAAVRGTINDVNNIVQHPPDDSNPSLLNYSLTQAQQYISMLKTKVENLEAASTHANQCYQADLLSQYWPAAPGTFQLPYEPEKSTLAQDLSTVQSLWKQAQQTHIVAGLGPPWLLSQEGLNKDLAPGRQAYATLQKTYQQDYQQMLRLRDQDYQQLSATIQAVKQGCP